MTGGVVSCTITVRDVDVARLLLSETRYIRTCVFIVIILGTPALTRDIRLNGAAVSVAVKPGSDHVDPPSTVTVHDDPVQLLPLLSNVSTGGVVSCTRTVRKTVTAERPDGSTQAYVARYVSGTDRFGGVGFQVEVGPAEMVPCATSAHVAPGLTYA
jgi:hypothetical protein